MHSDTITLYKKYRSGKRRFILITFLLLTLLCFIALMTGSHSIGYEEILQLIQGKGMELTRQIIFNIRLPRIIGATLTGALLSLSGAVMQIVLRNPLASPYTLGISNAAACGAACSIVFSGYAPFSLIAPYSITLSAFIGSLIGLTIILFIIRLKQASVETIVLSGIIINALFGAGIAVIQYLADNVQLASIVFWNFGDLGRSDWNKLISLSIVTLPAIVYFYLKRWDYKALSAGDDYAKSIGVSPQHTRIISMVITSLCTAVAVSFFGVIAFVGLVVPHIVQKFTGANEEFLILGSATFGSMFLLFCDTVARAIIAPVILPVGILTSFIGVPLFLFLLIRKKTI